MHPTARPPKILVSAQNEWYTQPTACDVLAGADTVITIGGSFFLIVGIPSTPDLGAFLDKRPVDVKDQLQRFLERHPSVSRHTTGLIIMDIEDPHPNDFHTHPEPMQDRLIKAFKIRAAAARATFPNARLGFYGTLVPDARGRADDPTYRARKDALARAGCRGMFDDVDCLIPVTYPRSGPTDRSWKTYAAYTRLGITGSRELRQSDGGALPVIPLLTYSVHNKNSQHHQQLLLDLPTPHPLKETLGVQLDVIAAEQVHETVFWVADNSDLITRVPNPHSRTVTDHICGATRG
jgi:hypothetical protein